MSGKQAWMPYELHLEVVAETEGERDRARALAVRFEEIITMRTEVIAALVAWRTDPRTPRPDSNLEAIINWAEAQLTEIP